MMFGMIKPDSTANKPIYSSYVEANVGFGGRSDCVAGNRCFCMEGQNRSAAWTGGDSGESERGQRLEMNEWAANSKRNE